MKRAIAILLVAIILIPTVCLAQSSAPSPLGVFTTAGDFIGIGMTRGEVEAILGQPFNEPFPDPVIRQLSLNADGHPVEYVGWPVESALPSNNSFLCSYNGMIVMYDMEAVRDTFQSEPAYAEYKASTYNGNLTAPGAETDAVFSSFKTLTKQYAEMSKTECVVIGLCVTGFDYEMSDGTYVGKTNVGSQMFSTYYDVDTYYYHPNDSILRELSWMKIEESLEVKMPDGSPQYSENQFVCSNVRVDRNSGEVKEIAIYRYDIDSYGFQYERLMPQLKTEAEREAESKAEKRELLMPWTIVTENGEEIDYEAMINDYFRLESEFEALTAECETLDAKEKKTHDDEFRELEIAQRKLHILEITGAMMSCENFNDELNQRQTAD